MALTTLLPHRTQRRRPFRSVTAAVALVVLLGACGGTVHDEGASGPTAAGSGASPSPAPAGAEAGAATGAATATDPTATDPASASSAAPTGSASPAGAGGPAAAQAGAAAGRPAGSPASSPAAAQAAGRAGGTTPAGGEGSTPGGPAKGSPNTAPAPSSSGGAPSPGGGVPAPTAPSPGGTGPGSIPAAQNGEIRIGMVYALSGPLAPNGRSMMEGFQAILSKVNDEGGIGGAKFKFLVRDDQFDPSQSKRAIRELIAQKIWAFSGFTPALWLAAKDDLKAAGVLGFPFDVGAERQRAEPSSFAGYQNCIRSQAGTIPNAIARGQKKLAFIELDIEAVHHCIDYSVALTKKLGGEVVFRGNVAPGAPDCGPQVLAARGANPQAVLST